MHPSVGAFPSSLCVNGNNAAATASHRLPAGYSLGHLSPPVLPLSLKMPLTPPSTSSPPAVAPTPSASSPKAESPASVTLSPSADHLAHHFNFPPPPLSAGAASAPAYSTGAVTPPQRASCGGSAPRLFQPYKLDAPEKSAI